MKELGIIRRLFYRDHLSLSEIERRTGLTCKTIRGWLKETEGTVPTYRRQRIADSKLTPFAEQLTKALETDLHRPKRERRSALKLFAELKAAGYTGSYSRVTDYIRQWRAQGGATRGRAFVPLQFELGEAFQFDWSEERLVIGGIWRRILAAHLKLCVNLRLGHLLQHLLKWQFQPVLRCRCVGIKIKNLRREVEDVLEENPSLRPKMEATMLKAYSKAKGWVEVKTGLTEALFSEQFPWTLEEVMSTGFLPD